MPSSRRRAARRAVIEASSYGLPALVTDTPLNLEVCLYIPTDDVAALATRRRLLKYAPRPAAERKKMRNDSLKGKTGRHSPGEH